jgi:chromosomal replication initiator protein
MTSTFPPKVWDGVLGRLEGELPPFAVEAWLRPLTPVSATAATSDGTADGNAADGRAPSLRLLCPSSFHRDRVRDHFLGHIEEAVRAVVGGQAGVRLELPGEAGPHATSPADGAATRSLETPEAPVATGPAPAPSTAPSPARSGHTPKPRTPAPPTRPRASARPVPAAAREATPPPRRRAVQQSVDNFVVGPCNALAREALLAMARDQQMSLDQVYLCADSGMGKTHLCRAVALEARRITGQRVVYASAENFTSDFMAAIRSKDVSAFKRRYRKECDFLIVENVSFFEGKTQTQLEFFHSVRHVLDAGGRVLMTGEQLPRRHSGLGESLRDQIAGGFVAEMEPPDAQVRRDILRAKAAAGGVGIPPDCLDLLVERVRGSVRDLEGVLIQLVTTATLLKRPIDLDLAREALAKKCDPGPESASGPGVDDVIGVVTTFFKTTRPALCSRSRRREILVPRQLAMYLCHRYTDASLTEIGRALGRDHPAVKNAIARVERSMLERAPLRYQVESLCGRLEELFGARA